MKTISWKNYAIGILLVEAIGGLAGWLTKAGREIYKQTVIKSPLTPPDILFPIVWSILYALMGIGAVKVWYAEASPARTWGLIIFVVQLMFNFIWNFIFFQFQAFGLAFLWLLVLLVLIILMIYFFSKVDLMAAKLQIPYLFWVAFATYLTGMVWYLNI